MKKEKQQFITTSRTPDGRADIALTSMRSNKQVFWSPRWEGEGGSAGGCNSYVLLETEQGEFTVNGKKVELTSINGHGEIRWEILQGEIDNLLEREKGEHWNPVCNGEGLKAARYFNLIEEGE